MKSVLQFIIASFFTLMSHAQHHDFDSLQNWEGALLDFDWKKNEILLNQNTGSNTLVYFEANWTADVEFKCNVELPFSPSRNNSFELLISKDSLFLDPNLISLKVGESGSSDGFDVFKGNTLEIYNNNRFWGSGGSGVISIICNNDSLFFFEKYAQDTTRFIGALHLNPYFKYIGFNCKYTKSNANKFNFNKLFFGIPPIDSVPPHVSLIQVNSNNEIELFFNESIRNNHLKFYPKPSSVRLNDSSIVLKYLDVFDFTLNILDSIQDFSGNLLKIDTSIFINYLNQFDLIITEIMANPDIDINSLTSEYLELYNKSSHPISLNGAMICIDGINEKLPAIVLAKNDYLLIYPKKSLLNNGSEVKIVFNNKIIHKVNYNLEWYKNDFKKTGGWSLEMIDFTKPCLKIKNWSATENISGGTPGFTNSINGELQDEVAFKLDYIFPINDTTLQITFNYDIQLNKGLDSIPLGNIKVYELHYKSNNLTLLTDPMEIDSVYHLIIQQPIKSCWKKGLIDDISLKFSLPSTPKEADLVINEILFDPDALGSDFIEIFNNTDQYFNLKKMKFGSLDEKGNIVDVHFLSKHDRLVYPFETIAFTEDLDWLREQFYNIGNVVFSELPPCNNEEDNILLMSTQGKIIDSLSYSDTWHYSELNSTENISLERISPNKSNIATNWFSASSNSGYGTPGLPNSSKGDVIEENKRVFIDHDVITPNNDGVNDFIRLNFNMNKTGWIGSIKVVNSVGIPIHTIVPHFLFGASERIFWNCELSDKSVLSAGIYVLLVKLYHTDTGEKVNKKITFYINRALR